MTAPEEQNVSNPEEITEVVEVAADEYVSVEEPEVAEDIEAAAAPQARS